MRDCRPDPDELLHRVAQNQAPHQGSLKIFFGYAAGVGKTYAMLEAAHAAQDAGANVLVGYLEPHTRPATFAVAEGLPALPPKIIEHRGIRLREFDLDAAIAARPQLVLVDELAHTNAGECRHRKRYQDVEELLREGIDVYTTVNVQHIESLNDIVQGVTGIAVNERIPDRIFDLAAQVEIVDIEPDELIERLNEGKIYKPGQAQQALQNFFTRDNLAALREIALRRIADHVNRAAERGRLHNPGIVPPTEEHILICLSSSPSNAKVIRTAARMANAFKGAFTALFVETPHSRELSSPYREELRKNLKLAEQLGAKVATVYGEEVAYQIAEYAKISGITKIVMGRSNYARRWFHPQPLVQQLSDIAPDLDIYIIPDGKSRPARPRRKPAFSEFSSGNLIKSSLILLGVTLLAIFFQSLGFTEENILILYVLGMLCTAIFTTGRVSTVVFSFLGVLIFNFFFTQPRFSFIMSNTGYPITFIIIIVAAFITGTLTTRASNQARQTAVQAHRTEILLDTSQQLQKAKNTAEIIGVAGGQIRQLLDTDVLVYPVYQGYLAEPVEFPLQNGKPLTLLLSPNERAVAQWVYKNNKHAGATTNTLPGAACLYLAVRNNNLVFAVVGIAVEKGKDIPTRDKSLLLAMLNEVALALEKEEMRQNQSKAAIQVEQERLQSNLLRAISHDFRTPLTSISGNAGVLMQNSAVLSDEKKQELYADIYDDSIWLANLTENLLSITRMENGTASLHIQPELVQEVVQEALSHIGRRAQGHSITTRIDDDMLMAKMDSRLIMQVILNIVDNALKYTPPGSSIEVRATKVQNTAAIEVADNGPGIAPEEQNKVLEMFYTAGNKHQDARRGLGLGLFLCKEIVEAHGGALTLYGNHPHGVVFRFTLPLQEEEHEH